MTAVPISSARSVTPIALWYVAGALVLSGAVGMAWVSPRAAAELAEVDRALLPLVGCYAVACAGFVLAAVLLWRRPQPASQALPFGVVFVALGARLAMLPTPLIQSDDAYRYVLDGHAVLAGVNPFESSPADLQREPPNWLTASPAAADILERVNHPEVPTIYPPLAQAAFAIGAWICPWSIMGPRIVFLICDALTVGLLLWWLRRLRKPLGWAIIYAWNPLVIKEIANSAHLDSGLALVLVALCGALLGAERRVRLRQPLALGRVAGIGVLLGLAILTKLYPVMLLPVVLSLCTRPGLRWGAGVVLLLSTALTVTTGYAPFWSVGPERLFQGLQTYTDHWVNNPGLFGLLTSWFEHPRRVAGLLVLGCAVALAVRVRSARDPGPQGVVGAIQLTLLLWLLMMPTCFPWYAVPLIAVATLRPRTWAVALTVAFGLFYGALVCRFADRESLANTLRIVEHSIFWAAALPDILRFAIKPRGR